MRLQQLIARLRRLAREERGSALTEMAIVSVLLIPITMYSTFFYETLQTKLKVQEAARFAAFEMANWPLHDYKEGRGGNRDKQRQAREKVRDGVAEMFRDWNSATTAEETKRLSIDYTEPRVRVSISEAPLIVDITQIVGLPASMEMLRPILSRALAWLVGQTPIGVASGFMGPIMGAPAPAGDEAQYVAMAQPVLSRGIRRATNEWGFNHNSRVTVSVRTTIRNVLVPRRFGRGWLRKTIVGRRVPTIRLNSEYTLIADSWKLHDGADVTVTGSQQQNREGGYYKTVDRIAGSIVGRQAWMPVLNQMYTLANTMGRGIGMSGDPTVTKLVSLKYGDRREGMRNVRVDGGQQQRHTIAFDDGRVEGQDQEENYKDTYDDRGEFFMGCRESQKDNCWDIGN